MLIPNQKELPSINIRGRTGESFTETCDLALGPFYSTSAIISGWEKECLSGALRASAAFTCYYYFMSCFSQWSPSSLGMLCNTELLAATQQ